MRNYKEWYNLREVGAVKSRPGGAFVANRSQLWGPSATFGHRDSPWTPAKQALGVVPGAIGSAILKKQGAEMTPTAGTQIELPFDTDGEEGQWIRMHSDVVNVVDYNGNDWPFIGNYEDAEDYANFQAEPDENAATANDLARKGPSKQRAVAKMRAMILKKPELKVDVDNPKVELRLFPEKGFWWVQYQVKFLKLKHLPKGGADSAPTKDGYGFEPFDGNANEPSGSSSSMGSSYTNK